MDGMMNFNNDFDLHKESNIDKNIFNNNIPKTSTIEIPSEPEKLSIKELKNLLDKLNVRHHDCFEKADLLKRISERKQ
jgi:hypothetical protein